MEIAFASGVLESQSIEMASDTETSVAVAHEPMDLSTPVKEENETGDIQTPTPTPTPRKRGRAANTKSSAVRTPKTPKGATKCTDAGAADVEDDGEGEGDADTDTEASPSKKGKNTGATKKVMGPIPTSYEAAGDSDRMILRMRDEEGRGWPDINAAWMTMTGISVGKTTLRMRYRTMKSNFVSLDAEDEPRLLHAKTEVEERFESEKWAKIADQIVSDGGKKYPAASLQKRYKAMMSAGNAAT